VSALNAMILLLRAEARGDGEGADVVGEAGRRRGDVVGECPVRDAVAVLALLAQVVQVVSTSERVLDGVHLDVVADRVGGKNPITPLAVSHFSLITRVEHLLGVVVELAGRLARGGVVEDVGERPFISQALKNGCQSMNSRSSARS
jgi:hypothetical protein